MTKKQVRARLREHRQSSSAFDVETAALNLAEWMYRLPIAVADGATIACYLPIGTEPGSESMLDALVDQGLRVIVPVVPDGDPAPLQWARYQPGMPLETRRWGLSEPESPSLPPEALADAAAIFVPALAVARNGTRLGRGAGYYDRSLPGTSGIRIAIVYDDEIVDELPSEKTDISMDWVLSPEAGFQRLGETT